MNCQELQFQQYRKRASETQDSSHSVLRRACVSLESTLCSGGAVSTSSMADPASLPLAAVSVSASNSRHSTRKRINPTQPDKTEAKRPCTRSQDTGTVYDISSDKLLKHSKNKQQSTSYNFESSITKSSLRNSRHSVDKSQTAISNNKLHNNHQISSVSAKHKTSVSLLETGNIELHRRSNKRSKSVSGRVNSEDNSDSSLKAKKTLKIEAGTSRWDITSSKKANKKDHKKESKSFDNDLAFHKYPLRSQIRLSGTDILDKNITDEQLDPKASATTKKKHKVRQQKKKYVYKFLIYLFSR